MQCKFSNYGDKGRTILGRSIRKRKMRKRRKKYLSNRNHKYKRELTKLRMLIKALKLVKFKGTYLLEKILA